MSHVDAQAEWTSLLLATMCSSIPSFTCEVPCGPVLQSCWLGLQNAYLLPQPWDSSFSCWGKWVKLIGSRRCVLSAGDLGHRFYIICSGLLTSSPPFMALPLHEGHCIQNEASCFTSPSWNPVSHLSSFGDRSSFVLSVIHARHTDGHSALHTTILCVCVWGVSCFLSCTRKRAAVSEDSGMKDTNTFSGAEDVCGLL